MKKNINKMNLFKEHLENNKKNLKNRILDILNGTSFEKFTSKNLQYIVNDLREIEILEDFLINDFNYIIRK